ncbi:MAG: VWA domain-containing protein [Granulosicoccus sp.]|nr:VWA domain-containing protein [Granulosicoccus sp.]
MGKLTRLVVASSLFLCSLVASGNSERPLYIIFDGSNSMWGELQDRSRKIETAQNVFAQLDDSLFENRPVALRVYGHRRKADCTDTELVAPFASGKRARTNLANVIGSVTPRGRTPIRLSLEAALQDFDGRPGDIFLISDGVETCDADPCELVASWRDQNIDIRVHVVGLGLTPAAQSAMQCIAAASGTRYMEAESRDELSAALSTFVTSPNLIEQNNPLPGDQQAEFKIIATDDQGRDLPVAGTLIDADGYHYTVSANILYELDSGEYSLSVGVPTPGGELYGEITDSITLTDSGPTVYSVVLPRPPQADASVVETLNTSYHTTDKMPGTPLPQHQ